MGPSFAISVFRICFPFRLPCRPHGNAPPSPEGDLGKELPGNFTPFSIPPDTLEKTPEENSQISRENLPNVWRNLQNFRVLG